jgi:Major capsid protein N-terminus/Large eukaryotic DNA virus major capsid protein
MSGGIVQLVATGVQDEWLTGKPEVSFFRTQYKRYTHYASSVERQVIQGLPSAGGISTVRLEKKGDLVSYMYMTARDQNNALVPNLDWSQVINRIQLFIGGQEIDSQDFQWMSDVEPVVAAQNMNQRYLNNIPNPSVVQANNQVATFFPLKFWFNKDWMAALPVVALAFHDVEIRITWSANLNNEVRNNAYMGNGTASTTFPAGYKFSQLNFGMWTNFVYLDAAEREYFAKTSIDQLITQVQRVPVSQLTTQELALAHPIKYLAFQSNNYNTMWTNTGITYSGSSDSSQVGMYATLRVQINGVDVGEDRALAQYTDVNQYYHTQFSYQTIPTGSTYTANVAIIPYCLDTTKLQPTGTLNFSRLDTYRLITPTMLKVGGTTGLAALAQPASQLKGSPGVVYLYAVNYNVLRIQKGMAGLLYAN